MLAPSSPKNGTATSIDANVGDRGDNVESYAAMSREALNMAHCCDAFLNGFQAFVLDVFVAEMRTL